jgi:hypothetical protein
MRCREMFPLYKKGYCFNSLGIYELAGWLIPGLDRGLSIETSSKTYDSFIINQ